MSYQAKKKHEETLNVLLLSERSQPEKATYCMTPTYMTFQKRQNFGD